MKICKVCLIEKSLEMFNNSGKYKTSKCKDCIKEYNKDYFNKNKKILSLNKKKYYLDNKEYFRNKSKEYYIENIDNIKYYNKEYSIINKEKRSEKNKIYYLINKKDIIINNNKYTKNRKSVDNLFRLKISITNTIHNSFNRSKFSKSGRTETIIGCSFEEFKFYIESKFENWMTWMNKGLYNGELNYGWDIDHIIPISSAKTEEDVIRLNHYTNLQPLCSKVNRDIKRNKTNEEIFKYN